MLHPSRDNHDTSTTRFLLFVDNAGQAIDDKRRSQLLSTLSIIQSSKMADQAKAQQLLIPFLVTMMLVTGVCNTLLTKYQASKHAQTSTSK